MRRLSASLCFLVVTLAGSSVLAQSVAPRYSEVRIALTDRADLRAIAERVPGLGHVDLQKEGGRFVAVTVLSEVDLADLAASTFPFEVSVPDVAAAYAARPPATEADRAAGLAASRVGGGFGYGSMGGYYTFDEVLGKLDELAADYPGLISERVSIGQSWEGRDLWMVKISNAPTVDEDEPEVLYTGLHHAREPQGMTSVLYYMYYLLENYGSDPEVTYLVDNRELYFVPVLNPDGYVYNETTSPNGGGFWRKNRRDNGGNSFGVDLNRNYAYEWGRDNTGSSPSPGGETYRGPGPFSEPETQAIRDFVESREIVAAFNYHSYSNVLLHPWGYEEGVYTPDQDVFTTISGDMTRVNGYEFGQAADVLYPANGDSDDWYYGEQTTKGKAYAWTPEVGRSGDGFWPDEDRIVPLAEENRVANLSLAWFAGAYPRVQAFEIAETHAAPNGYVDPGEPAALTLTLQNLGLAGVSDARARIVSTNPALPIESGALSAPFSLGPEGMVELEGLAFTLGLDAAVGLQDGLAVEMTFDGTTLVQPLGPISVGTPVAVFEDAAGSMAAWDTGTGWGLASTSTSPPTSFADSPTGSYGNNVSNALTLAEPLDLSDGVSPQLRFSARWDIESNYDFVQVRASTNGTNWTPLAGRYTRPGSGSGDQTSGEPGYDGTRTQWAEELMDLSAYEGEPEVYLQFRLQSDGSVTGDGFYLDDLAVETFSNGSTVANETGTAPTRPALYDNYPNPFTNSTLIPFDLPEAGPVTLTVYDLLGQRVRVLTDGDRAAGPHSVRWDGRDASGQAAASGVYVCTLRAAGAVSTRKLLVVR
ncbi:MAG: M14 family zinc carboxypeptidase [Rhodothermales bacterium]